MKHETKNPASIKGTLGAGGADRQAGPGKAVAGALLAGLLLCLALLGPQPLAAQDDFKVVVHSSNTLAELSRDDLSRIFLKRTERWPDGPPIVPVDQEISSPVRAQFSETVHQRKVSGIKSYWQAQIFSGRGVPPLEKEGDEAVVSYVRSNPGAIGYVSARASTDQVRALRIVD